MKYRHRPLRISSLGDRAFAEQRQRLLGIFRLGRLHGIMMPDHSRRWLRHDDEEQAAFFERVIADIKKPG